ncbi:MAG TPA: OsmC family protein [Burkholderiales bacterium]|jgi:organic hydroperoxide reductase OsmC/OhrA|nr:OsmC family protein [Burkholderiales bacterium]
MAKTHHYATTVRWTGNKGTGTSGYKDYDRAHEISAPGKPVIAGSSDPAFRGDPARYNPEDMMVASLSACHMLWYLHLAAVNKVVVVDYVDEAQGTMEEGAGGGGKFVEVTLRPRITVLPGADLERAHELHHEAHEKCFIANSVNFPVKCEPVFEVKG